MKILLTLFGLVAICQLACSSKSELPKNTNINFSVQTSPSITKTPKETEIDLQTEKLEAQKLLDSGITFDFTIIADGGGTEDNPIWTGHGYKSSDGVGISTSVGLYQTARLASKEFNEGLKEIEKFLERKKILDNKQVVGERIIAIDKNRQFVVGIKEGQGCKFYYSNSLSHVLAFEKWRDKE